MGIFSTVLYFAVMAIASLLIFWGGRKYVFSKVKVNKWILLGIAIVLLLTQSFLRINDTWITMIFTIVTLGFFIWFMDIQSTGGPKVPEKKIVIKPKAKPNRVKHLNKNK